MTRISFGPLFHQTLGFENFIRDVEKILDSEVKQSTFPPHNIIKADDNKYVVELAVAGFAKDEIDIRVQEGNLTIRGDKKDKDESNYLHRGIGTRSFTKVITIADTYGAPAGVGGTVNWYTGAISLVPGQQIYDLQLIGSSSGWIQPGDRVVVQEVRLLI